MARSPSRRVQTFALDQALPLIAVREASRQLLLSSSALSEQELRCRPGRDETSRVSCEQLSWQQARAPIGVRGADACSLLGCDVQNGLPRPDDDRERPRVSDGRDGGRTIRFDGSGTVIIGLARPLAYGFWTVVRGSA
jgi:hypothetical protein